MQSIYVVRVKKPFKNKDLLALFTEINAAYSINPLKYAYGDFQGNIISGKYLPKYSSKLSKTSLDNVFMLDMAKNKNNQYNYPEVVNCFSILATDMYADFSIVIEKKQTQEKLDFSKYLKLLFHLDFKIIFGYCLDMSEGKFPHLVFHGRQVETLFGGINRNPRSNTEVKMVKAIANNNLTNNEGKIPWYFPIIYLIPQNQRDEKEILEIVSEKKMEYQKIERGLLICTSKEMTIPEEANYEHDKLYKYLTEHDYLYSD